jgi:hypothetical protein
VRRRRTTDRGPRRRVAGRCTAAGQNDTVRVQEQGNIEGSRRIDDDGIDASAAQGRDVVVGAFGPDDQNAERSHLTFISATRRNSGVLHALAF